MFDVLNLIMRLSGLINAIFIPLFLYICWTLNKNFKFKEDTLSFFGIAKKTQKLFNFSFVIVDILQLIFIITLINELSIPNPLWLVLLVLFSGFGILFAAIIPYNPNPKIHNFFAYMGSSLVFISILCFNVNFLKINEFVGLVGIISSIIMFVGTLILFLRYKECSIPQIFLLSIVIVWNLFFSYVLFFL